MTQANSEKWQRYEQALLVAMGCADLPSRVSVAMYRLLIIPSFNAPCCLQMLLTNQEGELSFSLLTTYTHDLFDAVWRENDRAESATIQLARRACVEDITALDTDRVVSYRQQLAAIDPMTLGDIILAAYDGVGIRCDCSEHNRHHTFAMRSPTAQDSPRHSKLVALLLGAVRDRFPDQQIQEYLDSPAFISLVR